MILAEVNPNDIPAEYLKYWIMTAVFVVACLSAAAHYCFGIYDRFKQKPPLHELYATIPTFKKLEELVTKMGEAWEKEKGYQYKARQRMHRRINAQENALYYMAGRDEARGDSHSSRIIRERLEHGAKEEVDEA